MSNQERIKTIRVILEANPLELTDVQRAVKEVLEESLNDRLGWWRQCEKIKKLGNYKDLVSKVCEVSKDGNKWFYIGHTEQELRTMYIWTRHPDNRKFSDLENALVKSQTYYTKLVGVQKETENNLIRLFVDETEKICHERCLNVKAKEKDKTSGFVYVLIYKKKS